jgi:dTDP-4-dehydrorhamnose 3,5-epimerase
MHIEELALPGVQLISPNRFTDDRGYFEELYKLDAFAQASIRTDFVQDNLSFSKKGVVRGMHYPVAPHAQAKLVRVLQGRVMDVVADVRPYSPTYGQVLHIELSAESGQQLLVPEGYAHGFEAMEDTLFIYKCTAQYDKTTEGGIHYLDPMLAIQWQTKHPIVSEKDLLLPFLQNVEAKHLVF